MTLAIFQGFKAIGCRKIKIHIHVVVVFYFLFKQLNTNSVICLFMPGQTHAHTGTGDFGVYSREMIHMF